MTASTKPAFFEFRSSQGFIVFTVAIAVFTVIPSPPRPTIQ